MDSDKLMCKVIIRNGPSKTCSITGEIDINQLESNDSEWIIVENAVFGKNKCNFIELVIYKADIEKIVVFKPDRELTFDKSDLGLSNIIHIISEEEVHG